jgi:hypothetical protein
MPAKVPWLPSQLPPGAKPERCPRCGRAAFIPWTLRRDDRTKAVLRTWVCTECQVTGERPEPESIFEEARGGGHLGAPTRYSV